jgi:hypothetical protein
MSKKDYERAASIAQRAASEAERATMVAAFSMLFREDSPRFDFDRFRAACVPGANVRARKGKGTE